MDYITDTFNEQIVKVGATPKRTLVKIAIIVAELAFTVLAAIDFMKYFFVLPYVLIAVWVAGLFAMRNMNIEYEYIFTNGDLDIDKIIARRKRKSVLSVNLRNLIVIAPTSARDFEKDVFTMPKSAVFDCSSRLGAAYYAIFNTKEGKKCIIFEPSMKLMKAMRVFAPDKFAKFEF